MLVRHDIKQAILKTKCIVLQLIYLGVCTLLKAAIKREFCHFLLLKSKAENKSKHIVLLKWCNDEKLSDSFTTMVKETRNPDVYSANVAIVCTIQRNQ